jgi:N-acetylglucosaminyldiphosphoundecaprenol N-acetyl-beta-D-mannosaminyltransferase
VVANVFSVVLSKNNKEFATICNNADLVLPDGLPIVWASKLLRPRLPQRIAGPDFMGEFCGICAQNGYSMFLLGGRSDYLNSLVENLKKAHPRIQISGAYSPPFGEWDENENRKIIKMINDSHADVLWVGVSTPKQDYWIYENKNQLKTKVAIGVGAAFDFHSGRVKRAPIWMQKNGLEWLFRLLQEPRRMWKKYLVTNLLFISLIAKEFIKNKIRRKYPPVNN